MRAAVVNFPNGSISTPAFRLSTKNAWASYVRNRWPTNTLCEIQRAFKLTEGQARGMLYAQASQSSIDAALDSLSPVKAFALGLEILCIRLNVQLEEYITNQAEEARRERTEWEARERHLAALSSRILESGGPARGVAEQAGAGRSGPSGNRQVEDRAPLRGRR